MIEVESIQSLPQRYSCEITKKIVECDEVLSLEDVCKWLGVCDRTIMHYVEEYDFPCKKVGKTRLFGKKAIIDWVNHPD